MTAIDNTGSRKSRKLRVHPAILLSIIERQAGSLSKALLEAVMNAVDANATKCAITLTSKEFTVTDNGKGFTDSEEIDKFFETCGTPHVEGDVKYGRYRMGRGQIFSFGRNVWRTGTFQMEVDIKNTGLDYTLVDDLPHVQGCTIKGELYRELSDWELQDCINDFKKMVKYVEVPISLNGSVISSSASKAKWDFETDDAYIKLSKSSHLQVYNMGVWVKDIYSGSAGSGGVCVTKSALKVNFARNDILEHECELWRRTRSFIREKSEAKVTKKSTLTEGERDFLAQSFINTVNSSSESYDRYDTWNAISSAKIVPTAAGRNQTIQSILSSSALVFVSDENMRLGERLHRSKAFFGVTQATLDRFKCWNIQAFSDLIHDSLPRWESKKPRIPVKDFSEFNTAYALGFETVPLKELSPIAALAFRVMNNVHKARFSNMLHSWDKPIASRKFFPGKSDSALAWTDGVSSIHVETRFLVKCARDGLSGWHRLGSVLLHEYCHGKPDLDGHAHDHDFFEMFEELTTGPSCALAEFALEATIQFNKLCVAKGISIPSNMLKKMHLLKTMIQGQTIPDLEPESMESTDMPSPDQDSSVPMAAKENKPKSKSSSKRYEQLDIFYDSIEGQEALPS